MILPAGEQEENVQAADNMGVMTPEPVPQAVAQADFVLRVQCKGGGRAIAQGPQAMKYLGRTCPSRI